MPWVRSERAVDLAAGLLAATAAVAMAAWLPQHPARVALGILLALFLPGHALLAALAPHRHDPDPPPDGFRGLAPLTRFAASWGLSVGVIVAVGLLLNGTIGVSRVGFRWALWGTTVGLYAWAFARRRSLPPSRRPRPRVPVPALRSGDVTGLQVLVSVVLVAAIGVTGVALQEALSTPHQPVPFTEFYAVGPGGSTAHLPSALNPDETGDATVGVVNREDGAWTYTVRALRAPVTYGETEGGEAVPSEGDGALVQEWTVRLEPGERWQTRLALEPPELGTEKLTLHLYKGGAALEPYRELFLWLRVVPEGGSL